MIENLQAAGVYVFVIKDEPEKEIAGFVIPDQAKKKPNTGQIISVGSKVSDPEAKTGVKAIFAQGNGIPVEIFGTEIHILREDQVLGYISDSGQNKNGNGELIQWLNSLSHHSWISPTRLEINYNGVGCQAILSEGTTASELMIRPCSALSDIGAGYGQAITKVFKK